MAASLRAARHDTVAAMPKRPLLLVLARPVGACAVRAAALRTGMLYVGVALVASLLFGPQGMRAADAVVIVGASRPIWLAIWATWLVAATPVAHALLEVPATYALRSLPLPRWYFWLIHGALLCAAQLPWTIFWTRGAGALAGAAATLAAAAGHALIVARLRTPAVIALSVLLAATLAWRAPWGVLLCVALVAGAVGLTTAWGHAPARLARRTRRRVFGAAPVALALAHLATLSRASAALLVRGVFFAGASAGIVSLAVRNNVLEDDTAALLSLGVAAPALVLGASAVAVQIAAAEHRDRWVLDTTGTGGGVRALGASLACGLWTGLLAALHGLIVWLGTDVPGVRLLGEAVSLGAALGAAAAACARWARQGGDTMDRRLVFSLLATVLAFEGALYTWGEPALGLAWIAALGLSLHAAWLAARLAWRDDRAAAPGVEP